MKKKFAILSLVIVLLVSLAACGSSLTKENTAVTEEFIGAVDNYLDGVISADEAYDIISKYYENVEITDNENASEITSAMNIAYDIISEMTHLKHGYDGDVELIIERRNELADIAGLNERR